ncbi:MAG: 3-methyl-2-oxobutanoate hydroxymethyltransferase [Acidobacteria bacterium]|nr:3-methyl-2-oxobutanoate hydroxymethyltransferase [Acidobacteriota bacterium]
MEASTDRPVTVPSVIAMKGNRRIAMLTAYDYPSAKRVDMAGADIILVGDSLAMVVLGHSDTLNVTVDEMLHHTRAVSRGANRPLIVGDMPWLSYHLSTEETVRNAAAFIRAGARAVKMEGGKASRIRMIEAIRDAEIPVMGHVGLTPQSVNVLGGFKVQGREADAARRLIDEAAALEEAGCFSVVLECVPAEIAAHITERLSIPTIGIGAGPGCDGQVLVYHDLVGLYDDLSPRFVRRYAEAGALISDGLTRWIADVRDGIFPDSETESFHLSSDEELKRLYARPEIGVDA